MINVEQSAEKAKDKDTLILKNIKGVWQVRVNDIMYIESERRRLHIKTESDEITVYGQMGKLMEQLPEHFIRCHQSYLVNADYIRGITPRHLELQNQKRIPISRNRMAHVKARLKDLWGMDVKVSEKHRGGDE